MAFSSSITAETAYKPSCRESVITLADTAGVSPAFQLPDARAIGVQVEGAFGGGTVTLEASNDGNTFYPVGLTNPAGEGSPFAGTSAGIAVIHQCHIGAFKHYRMRLAGGDNSTSITVTIGAALVGR